MGGADEELVFAEGPGRRELPLSLGWRRGLQASVHTAMGCVLTHTTQEANRPMGVALISSDQLPCEDRDNRSSPAHSKAMRGHGKKLARGQPRERSQTMTISDFPPPEL